MKRHLVYPLRVHERGCVAHITMEFVYTSIFPVVLENGSHEL